MTIHESIAVHNVRGIQDFRATFRGGVNFVLGANGAGKSTVIAAAEAAAGADNSYGEFGSEDFLQPRRGSERGRVDFAGVRMTIGGKTKKSGHPTVQLADQGALMALIGPAYASAETRAKHRVTAALRLRPITVDEDVLLHLCGGDTTVAASVQGQHPDWDSMPLDAVADAVRKAANRLGLATEEKALELKGAAQQTLENLPFASGRRPTRPAAEISAEVDRVTGDVAVMRNSAVARLSLEQQQATIRESLGDEPDVDGAAARAAAQREEVDRLRDLLADARALLSTLEAAEQNARQQAQKRSRDLATLAKPLDGPTQNEAGELAAYLEALKETLASAKAWEERDAGEARYAELHADHERTERQAVGYRLVAETVPTAIADVLRQKGLGDGLTLASPSGKYSELALRHGSEDVPIDGLSFGERVRWALAFAVPAYKSAGAGCVFHVRWDFWAALSPGHRWEMFNLLMADPDLMFLVEVPAECPLTVAWGEDGWELANRLSGEVAGG